jgi:hypothetical protein
MFHEDGQTHRQTDRQKTVMTNLTVTCHNFAMHLTTQALPQPEHNLCPLHNPVSY